jgi:thiopeptide-type bacteriocin biosynthesis protein
VQRPPLRKYEIAYLAKPAVIAENQIPVSDLMVSCVGDKVILRSRRLNKEVIPRLTTSHNFMMTDLPIYKFLCDLQMQDVNTAIIWDWDVFIEDSYLPRVMYKNIMLSPATWNINFDELAVLQEPDMRVAEISKEYLLKAYSRVQSELGLPAKVVIMNSDQKLFIDLEEEVYVRLFHNYFQKNKRIRLQEFLFVPDNCFIRGEQGKFAHEVIIPHSRRKTKETERRFLPVQTYANKTVRREFAVGSEWLFLKLYTANATAERILKENIGVMVRQLRQSDLITKWFFIRYADPKSHLRIRFFHATDKTFWKGTVDKINSMVGDLSGNEVIVKVKYDTYERELGRYGYNKIELSESLFHHDSEAVVSILGMLDGDDSEELRWLIALRNIDMLLSDFRMDLESKHKLLELLKNDFYQEFKVDKEGVVQLDRLYRTYVKRIGSIINSQDDEKNGIVSMVAALEERSNRNVPVTEGLCLSEPDGRKINLPGLIASHVHMALNRMLVSDHRKQELVIYYLLARYYQSRLGFIKYN